ncbi:NYN domain-containing protein [Palleronia marisminoris]|nr:NYN domain-containing protein [Palleronia marisminoris]
MRTAVLVDGGFFVRRFPKLYPAIDRSDAAAVAAELHRMCLNHMRPPPRRGPDGGRMDPDPSQVDDLHRIFFYDCPPLTKRAHQPISGRSVNLAKTDEAVFRLALHDSLRRQRKVALRLGHLDEKNAEWELRPGVLKSLLRGDRAWAELTDEDFRYYARQKVVDLKIGVDIALLAEKKLVDRIVLMAGDSDFVPASKHARREGLDIVLDPLWNPVMPDLWEHIDGLRSTSPRPRRGEEA